MMWLPYGVINYNNTNKASLTFTFTFNHAILTHHFRHHLFMYMTACDIQQSSTSIRSYDF